MVLNINESSISNSGLQVYNKTLCRDNITISSYIDENGYLISRFPEFGKIQILPNSWEVLLQESDLLASHQANDIVYFKKVLSQSPVDMTALDPETVQNLTEIFNICKDL